MSGEIEVVIWAPSLGALRHLNDVVPLNLDAGGPRRHEDGTVTIAAVVDDADLEAIGGCNWVRVAPTGTDDVATCLSVRKPLERSTVLPAVR